MWHNSSRSIDHVSISFLWTKKFNKEFYLWKKFGLFLFLTDKFLYPCVSFVSLSLLSLTMLLFKIFDCRFCIYWLAISTCVFATLAIIGTTLVCGQFGSRVSYTKNFNLFLFCSRLFSDATCYTWTVTGYLASWRRFLWWRSWLVKNLSTLMGYTTVFYWWEPHSIWLYCRGKTHRGGFLWML